jgi:hypothetical protein
MMKRLGGNFSNIFVKDSNGYYMEYYWHSKQYRYYFKSFGIGKKTNISNDKLYIEYKSVSDKKFGNESSLIFVDGKIIVKINFATKDVTYLDVDPIPTTAEAIYSSVYGSLKDAYYE